MTIATGHSFDHRIVELAGIASARLGDAGALASLVVAAAGAIGLAAETPPVTHQGGEGAAIALVCLDGHVVMHTRPAAGICLIDVVGRAHLPLGRGVDVIMRKLGATA